MRQDDSGEPSENDIFIASDGFGGEQKSFTGIDAFAPGGPVPQFGAPKPTSPQPAPIGCREVQRSLELYLDGELVPAQQQLMASHLSGCLACQSVQLFQTQLRTVVAQKALEPMPADVRERITRALGIE